MSRFLAQLLGIEFVPVLVDEWQIRERHSILLPNDPLQRIPEPNDHHRLQRAGNREILPHLLILNPRVDSGDDSQIPSSQLHILDSPTSVDQVKTKRRIRKNNHRKTSTRAPAPRRTILSQPLQHLSYLDENEPPLLLLVP